MAKSPIKRLLFFLPFVSWIPMLIWGLTPMWATTVFGPDALTIDSMNNGNVIAIGITVVCIGMIVVLSFLPFIGPMFSFFGGSSETKRILREGRPATGKIIAIGESSQGGTITVNDQPYLGVTMEINDGFRTPYQASIDTIVPRYAIPQYQPGAVINVMVDKEDPEKIAIIGP
ncbi:MAG: hypothetical protein GY771_04900 [bacterium]|nr:hypothetical protein [bacterium]